VRYAAPGNPRPKPQEALRESPQGHGRDFGRQASEEDKVPAPKAYADARRPCVRPRTQFGNPSTPIRSPGPFRAGGQAPPFHRVTKSRQGKCFAIPRTREADSKCIYIHIYICIYVYIPIHLYLYDIYPPTSLERRACETPPQACHPASASPPASQTSLPDKPSKPSRPLSRQPSSQPDKPSRQPFQAAGSHFRKAARQLDSQEARQPGS
jgi:hypothetical protein